jgi:hypothetical protein
VTTIVTNYMAGETKSFTGFTVTVSGTHAGTSYSGNAVSNLAAGDMITVTVTGQYLFMNVIPLIKMPTSFNITSAVSMVCEGAT